VRPSDARGHAGRARALVELGLLDQAEAELGLANELAGDSPGRTVEEIILLATGRLHEQRGDRAAAARSYEAALAANPVSDEARRLLRALELTAISKP
jgi:tetratricopeptide (TPR) repeat protein